MHHDLHGTPRQSRWSSLANNVQTLPFLFDKVEGLQIAEIHVCVHTAVGD